MKLPAHVLFRKDLSLILWKPRGILDESTVNEVVEFIEAVEKGNREPLNRFSDLSALDAVDLDFDFVFHIALGRRLSAAPRPAVKSAFYVATPSSTHYVKLHGMLTDYAAARGLVHRSRPRGQVARRSAPGVVGIRAEENPASKT